MYTDVSVLSNSPTVAVVIATKVTAIKLKTPHLKTSMAVGIAALRLVLRHKIIDEPTHKWTIFSDSMATLQRGPHYITARVRNCRSCTSSSEEGTILALSGYQVTAVLSAVNLQIKLPIQLMQKTIRFQYRHLKHTLQRSSACLHASAPYLTAMNHTSCMSV